MAESGMLRRGLRLVAGYVRTHPGPFSLAFAGAMVYAFTTVAGTFVLGRITDRVLRPAFVEGRVSGAAIAWGAASILIVALVRAGAIVTRRFFAGMTGARMERTLRSRVTDRYQDVPLRWHRSQPTGELIARAETDVVTAVEILNPTPYATAAAALIITAAVALVVTDPVLAIVGLGLLPSLTYLNRRYMKRIEGPANRAQERQGEVAAVAHESFDGALVVKTLGRQTAEVDRLARAADNLRAERLELARRRASYEPLFEAIPSLGLIALVWVGAWRVSRGDISPGTIVQFASLFSLVAFPARLLAFVLADDIPRSLAGRARVAEVEAAALEDRPAGGPPLPEGPLDLRVDGLTFGYTEAPVLRDVTFHAAPGESIALVGPTGAGKSTLMELVARLETPRAGTITLGSLPIDRLDTARLRAAVAIVFQESFLFADSVRANITLGADIPHADVEWAARLAQAHDFVSALPEGYDTVLGERGVTLSGGQRQRLALSRALVRRPRLLILDDATSAVDPTVEAAILDGLQAAMQTTLLLVAYRVSSIRLADRVLYLDEGRIASSGSHDALLAHPGYRAMVQAYERGAA